MDHQHSLDQVLEKARLIGLLSNRNFGLSVGKLTISDCEPVAPYTHTTACGCGCGSAVVEGRKFLNQQHYDQSKGLPEDLASQVLARLRAGESAKRLACELGVAHTTIYRLLRKSRLR